MPDDQTGGLHLIVIAKSVGRAIFDHEELGGAFRRVVHQDRPCALWIGRRRDVLGGELRERLTEELDYENEAANQRFFADAFAGHPFISIPRVIDELSTARVLTTELAVGSRFAEVEQWSQTERDLAGEAIYRFVFGSIYRLQKHLGQSTIKTTKVYLDHMPKDLRELARAGSNWSRKGTIRGHRGRIERNKGTQDSVT